MIKQRLLVTFMLSGLAFFTNKINASQEPMEVYSCDTCDYEKASIIAKEHFKIPSCRWEAVPGGQVEFGQSLFICDTSSKDLIVANPIEKIAFKFNVRATNISSTTPEYGFTSTVNDLSLTTSEKDLLNTFYTIDQDFRSAVSSSSYISSSVLQSSFQQMYNTSNNEDNCNTHPTSYFESPRSQSEVHDELTNNLANELDGANWFDFFEDTDFSGGGLTLSKDGLGFQINLQHNEIGTFISKVYGSSNNLLNFEVKYSGEINIGGTRKLNLTYKLNRGASTIDGIRMNLLFSPVVDLTDVAISNCLSDFIEENSEIIDSGSGGGSGTPDEGEPGSGQTGGGSSIGGSCTRKVKTRVCSTDHNGTTCTNSLISVRC
ncbi:hypothetical protein NH514_06555 [Pseudoalteromonas sp. ACER1]|uniref:hypothetical protein n=1 Tax=unclassified Pseudoalteromonas TaxID=194690 RepID=UPI001F229C4A|nr:MULTISPECIES: hypothetical protein [unclassified Pseudoalteromonas]MCF2846836.1 hypothetical protein [Pseudoalteromonas sp. PAST1]MCO7210402.1 hypothetical protein [Pseudoalteromonas sp. ACER1]